jgi:hypothetical protein
VIFEGVPRPVLRRAYRDLFFEGVPRPIARHTETRNSQTLEEGNHRGQLDSKDGDSYEQKIFTPRLQSHSTYKGELGSGEP